MTSRPAADAVDVLCTDDELIVTLADGRRVGGGVGIHWEAVDEDISVRGLLAA